MLQADSADSESSVGAQIMPWLNFHIKTMSETIAYCIVTKSHMRN